MNPLPLELHHFRSDGDDNLDIYIEDACMKSNFYEDDELTFNLEGYGKFRLGFSPSDK